MKNKLFVLAIAVVAVVGFFVMKNAGEKAPVTSSPTQASLDTFIRPHSPSFGNRLGRVTVVEWFDPECEACRIIHPIFKKIKDDYSDRVHFVLRYMPFHGNSMYASSVLEEAKDMGKFEEALDILFETQPEWGDHHQPRPELIPGYMSKLGLSKESLEKDAVIKKHGDKVRQDEEDGKAVGVQGTPTFFVNGRMVQRLGEEPLRAAIEAALRENQ